MYLSHYKNTHTHTHITFNTFLKVSLGHALLDFKAPIEAFQILSTLLIASVALNKSYLQSKAIEPMGLVSNSEFMRINKKSSKFS